MNEDDGMDIGVLGSLFSTLFAVVLAVVVFLLLYH
jgi:hypothetical protein